MTAPAISRGAVQRDLAAAVLERGHVRHDRSVVLGVDPHAVPDLNSDVVWL